MTDGVIPTPDAWDRTSAAVRHYEKTYRDPVKKGQKRTRFTEGCVDRNEVWQFSIKGVPTGGTWDLHLNVLGTTDTLTFNWDDTATEIQTELETHTNIASGDVEVTGGPSPNAVISIEFKGDLANHRMPHPNFSWSSLTGGTGVGIDLARFQPGHSKDGSVAP